jgi:UDP-glucose 4-epimerase
LRRSEYSGVITKFMDALAKDRSPTIFGDGLQTRDFIYVSDVVEAGVLALQKTEAVGEIINVATGKTTSINDLVDTLMALTEKKNLQPIHGESKEGDIRHSYANVDKAERVLGFRAKISLKEGLRQLLSDKKEA